MASFVVAAGIAIASQVFVIYALMRHRVDAPWPIYLSELVGAALWTSILLRAPMRP